MSAVLTLDNVTAGYSVDIDVLRDSIRGCNFHAVIDARGTRLQCAFENAGKRQRVIHPSPICGESCAGFERRFRGVARPPRAVRRCAR